MSLLKVFESTDSVLPYAVLLLATTFVYSLTLDVPFWYWIVALVVYSLYMGLGITATYHRLLCHNSFKTNKFWRYLGTFLGGFAMTGSAIGWVAVHRQHHKYSDTEGDPHDKAGSPWWKVMLLEYKFKFNNFTVKDLFTDPVILFQHRYYFLILMVWAVFLYAIDPMVLLFGFLIPAFFSVFATGLGLLLIHGDGKQDYNTNDKSVNSMLASALIWGEGWHNNHHNNPGNPKFGEKWYQIDPGYWFVRIMKSN